MFPFNLSGPQFLVFYGAFAAAVILISRRLNLAGHPASSGGLGRLELDALTADPYLIACLRGGPEEAVRVAVVNLVDRGLLGAGEGPELHATAKADFASQRRALDRVILARCQRAPLKPADIGADREVAAVAAQLEAELGTKGLLHSEGEKAAHERARRFVVLLLAGVALARIAQALLAGRTNIVFLILLAGIACLIAFKLPALRISRAGRRALSSLQSLMKRLKDRASRLAPGGATNEAVLLAAVFGIHALPAQAFPFVEQAYPKPRPSSDSGSSSSDGGGSSDSGGCGGGGGCGGCGGS